MGLGGEYSHGGNFRGFSGATKRNADEAKCLSALDYRVGWLMGLEPTTTRITI